MTTDQAVVAIYTQPYGLTYTAFPINIYKVRMVLFFLNDPPPTEKLDRYHDRSDGTGTGPDMRHHCPHSQEPRGNGDADAAG